MRWSSVKSFTFSTAATRLPRRCRSRRTSATSTCLWASVPSQCCNCCLPMRRRSRCCSTRRPYRFGFGQSLSWAALYSSSLLNWKRSSSGRCSRHVAFPPCSLLPLESGFCTAYYLLGGTAGVGRDSKVTASSTFHPTWTLVTLIGSLLAPDSLSIYNATRRSGYHLPTLARSQLVRSV